MKYLILILFLSLFTFTGCSFLGLKTQMDSSVESAIDGEDSESSSEGEDEDDDDEYYDDEDDEDDEDSDDEDDEDSDDEDSDDEDSDDEDDEDSDDEDSDDEDSDNEDSDDEDSDDEDSDDEDSDDEDSDDEDSDDEDKEGGISGFFNRLFGSSELDDEVIDDEEGYEEDTEYADSDEESYIEESDEDVSPVISQTANEVVSETVAPTIISNTKINIPLQKIRAIPYRVNSYLVNGVYIARSNENLKSISQRIYGRDQTESLYIINSHLKTRSVKVGDKIYYNSPNRSNDQSRLLFYYDDIGIPPTNYKLFAGQNIRNISQKLLGNLNSWKEIWATNPNLKSKGSITYEVNISYWPEGSNIQASAPPQPKPTLAPELPPSELVEDLSPNIEEPPRLALPEASSVPQFEDLQKHGYLSLIMKNKETFGIGLGLLLFIVLMIRIIVSKRRKQREFDYTSSDIKL